MVEISKREQFYMQEYCGCVDSLRHTNKWRVANGRPKITSARNSTTRASSCRARIKIRRAKKKFRNWIAFKSSPAGGYPVYLRPPETAQRPARTFGTGEIHLLLAVAKGLGGVRMHFDEQAVGAHRDRAAHSAHEIGAAATLAGIDDDGEVGFLFRDGHRGEIERVARVRFEGADAALAEQDVRVAVGEDVFGGEQPFLDVLAQAALEQDRLAGSRGGDEELEVLPVAGADLQDVRVLGDVVDVMFAEHLGDDLQAGFLLCQRRAAAGPSLPRPWNSYGDVRGLNAPPRRIVAPAAFTAAAV